MLCSPTLTAVVALQVAEGSGTSLWTSRPVSGEEGSPARGAVRVRRAGEVPMGTWVTLSWRQPRPSRPEHKASPCAAESLVTKPLLFPSARVPSTPAAHAPSHSRAQDGTEASPAGLALGPVSLWGSWTNTSTCASPSVSLSTWPRPAREPEEGRKVPPQRTALWGSNSPPGPACAFVGRHPWTRAWRTARPRSCWQVRLSGTHERSKGKSGLLLGRDMPQGRTLQPPKPSLRPEGSSGSLSRRRV